MTAITKPLSRDDFSFGVGSELRTGPRRFEEVVEVYETDTYCHVTVKGAEEGELVSLAWGEKITYRNR
jgi:hypothetical protein